MTKEIAVKVSKKLRKLRQKLGYTQEKLSELAGIDYKHIQLLESKTPPAMRIDTLEKLAKALKTTSKKLLGS